ncbi:aldehyde dehydrogenase family protein [Nocardia sp. SYP-A9097]|uniref:aldehyde dehydrogenase (NADP(+)) n=1 Tax=Nocardia sp. SYP-A9097 TaxID=2663237 RepID=UPI00129BA757|nr:aldehyde dehydrogenase (NADP(+)) [Nocardia sp. SYP-A9097]MRH91213.1 aldehyde dehydrogenase family protein [Nocardia sp. SYP-A9097]
MTTIAGTDPRTGSALPPVTESTTDDQLDRLVDAAHHSAAAFAALARSDRATLLDTIAAEVERRRDELIETASRETGFGEAKLSGELTRTAFQFRFFADVVREGSYLEAIIDPAADTPMGPRPDLRRILTPLGVVAVFGASNFPFAFSVLGGDTASALAAGNPVVIKAHESHPATSQLSYEVIQAALAYSQAPVAAVAIVFGREAGARLVAHPQVTAVGFTGSLTGGQALLDIIGRRAVPIPFYGELSSLNPVIVTPGAAADRGAEIGTALVASFTAGSGQLCTKPGFVLVPSGPDGDRLVHAARAALGTTEGHLLLNERTYTSYTAETATLERHLHTVKAPAAPDAGFAVTPVLFETQFTDLDHSLIHEVFGPVTVIARYEAEQTETAATRVFDTFPPSLTATLHVSDNDEAALVARLTRIAATRAGRILFDNFPTGVAVSWAQTHGGPWPSTNSLHTSVGATAIRRFLRPITYQNAPEAVLPEELRDNYTAIPRRMDGQLRPSS